MIMKGYTAVSDESCAMARSESENASFKDLAEVCGRIRGKNADWAIGFLEKAAEGTIPVLYKRHNKKLGHRRELGGRQGRYPKKAAKAVLKVLNSALANGRVKGLGDEYRILSAVANKKATFGRVAPKGRWARSDYETSRIEIILKSLSEIPKGVEVTPPKKEEKPREAPKPEKKAEVKEKPREEPKKEAPKKEEKKPDVKKEVHE